MTDLKERFVSKEVAETHKAYLFERGQEYNSQNPFSKILRGEMPAKIVRETPYAVTIQNQVQRTKVYNLVLPVYPAKDLFDFADTAQQEDLVGYGNAIREVVRDIYKTTPSFKESLNTSCARIVFNIGPYSQNTVPHLHAHVMADEDLIDSRHLTLSQECAQEMDLWSKGLITPSVNDYEKKMHETAKSATQIKNDSDEHIELLKNGQKLGWKKTVALDNMSYNSLSDLIRFLRVVASLSSMQKEWGGRAVIDINNQGHMTAHASGDIMLRKLPLTPLTKEQLMVKIQNTHS